MQITGGGVTFTGGLTVLNSLLSKNYIFEVVNSIDGNKYTRHPMGDYINYPYSVYDAGEIIPGGLFDGASIPNVNATWRVITARSLNRWGWYDGGGYVFNAIDAPAGDYIAIYEVKDWDGEGNNATASVTVSIS